jgi:hypothetical protein
MPFTPKFVDLVRNFTTSQGTGPITLGQAVSGYAGLAEALSVGDQFYYCIQHVDKPEREVGRGTLQANGRVAREPVSGSLTNFSSGTKTIGLVAAAEWFSKLELGGGSIEAASIAALEARTVPSTTPAMLVENGREGLFRFVAGNLSARVAADPRQGLYVAPQSDPTGASGAWVRLFDGPLRAEWFGAVGDNATDDRPAIQAALDFLAAIATSGYGYGKGSPPLSLMAKVYYCGGALDIRHSLIFEGQGAAGAAGASVLRFPAGTSGIRVQSHDTQGEADLGGTGTGGGGSVIRGIFLQGAYSGTEGEFHGVLVKRSCILENLFIWNFQGDGIHIRATAGSGEGAMEGNANCWRVEHCLVQSCRNGLYLNGADTNAGSSYGFNALGNRQAGIFDSSFLSNTHIGAHADTNGIIAGSRTLCSFNGNRYYVLDPDAAVLTAPSGTTASNAAWAYFAAGGPTVDGALAWESGMAWRIGGPYISDNSNAGHVFTGCYSESGQPPSQFTPPTVVVGEGHYAGAVRFGYGTAYGGWLACGSEDGLTAYRNFRVMQGLTVEGDARVRGDLYAEAGLAVTGNTTLLGGIDIRSSNVGFGPTSGSTDFSLQLRSTSTYNLIDFHTGGAVRAQIGTVGAARLVLANATPELWLYANNEVVAKVDEAGLDVQAGNVLKIGGTQVIGARGAGVADATDAASAVTQLNALLARCRAHGLIAS